MGDVIKGIHNNTNIQRVIPIRERVSIDKLSALLGWTVINDDADNIVLTDNNLMGPKALQFDKVDGAGDATVTGVFKLIPSKDLSQFLPNDLISFMVKLVLTNVFSITIRLGTDSSNYSVWTILDSALTTAVWNHVQVALSTVDFANQVGNGHNMNAIKYAALVVTFDAAANTLTPIIFDQLDILADDN